METVFNYNEGENALQAIRRSNQAIQEIFGECDKEKASLSQNLQADSVSEAAENTYNSLKKHYEEFNTLIENNAQNINIHAEEMRQAEKTTAGYMESAQSNQNLQ